MKTKGTIMTIKQIKEDIADMIAKVAEGNEKEAFAMFNQIVSQRASDATEGIKQDVMQAQFNGGVRESVNEAYGDKRDHKKIDLHLKTGKYIASTTWSPSCAHAVKQYEDKNPEHKGQVKAFYAEK
jgi:hypothetical protein